MTASQLPRIYVFCNIKNCDGSGNLHNMGAMSEDGVELAGHLCSSHEWAAHDMGINENGLKRDVYAQHYPGGFIVEWVEHTTTHAGVRLAFERYLNRARAKAIAGDDAAPTGETP